MRQVLPRVRAGALSLTVSVVTFMIMASAFSHDACADDGAGRQRGLELFEKRVRPALIRYCYECHSTDSDDIGGDLLVDSRDAIRRGGEMGAAIRPGKPAASLLIQAIEYRDLEMPPDQQMPDDVIADFRRWVSLGAPDPRIQDPTSTASMGTGKPTASPKSVAEDHWAFQPVRVTAVPHANKSDWPLTEVDRYVLARLRQSNLSPNSDAKPEVLLRRVYFDLIGLPPSPVAIASFTANPSAEHYAQIVDDLLASDHFGERWGRHWLDVARYGESAGSSRDVLMIYAWRYRD
ncbi:MAG: DUF1549 domain-containing protein, partial [Planctomycetota bacterium]